MGERRRVLVIDDEPAVARMIRRVLRADEVETVHDGASALELLERDRGFGAVLCDVRMPGMSGLELHGAVIARWPEVAPRFVFVTGGVVDQADEEALASLPNRCMHKPFSPQQLRHVVEEVARRSATSPC